MILNLSEMNKQGLCFKIPITKTLKHLFLNINADTKMKGMPYSWIKTLQSENCQSFLS